MDQPGCRSAHEHIPTNTAALPCPARAALPAPNLAPDARGAQPNSTTCSGTCAVQGDTLFKSYTGDPELQDTFEDVYKREHAGAVYRGRSSRRREALPRDGVQRCARLGYEKQFRRGQSAGQGLHAACSMQATQWQVCSSRLRCAPPTRHTLQAASGAATAAAAALVPPLKSQRGLAPS